ncbi:MAG TPA: MupA/Atu3671 family FMN-dependent luciferase-like monooxygenase [Pyrinomonadaceae bacterium]
MTFAAEQNGGDPMQFGLLFFSSSESVLDGDKYRLLIESSRYADRHGFSSVWLPERHFTKEGGLYPNPAVLQAALARETNSIQLRAGSVVMPLQNPLRVAEEWAVVDNLSGGRVGVSFASGWHPNDFVFFPEKYGARHEEMYRGIEIVKKLWRGESIQVPGVDGKQVEVRVYPTPLQKQLPIWVTASGSPQTFTRAGEIGAHLLTNLLNQSFEDLTERIALYRQALVAHGHDPRACQVTVMMPTFIGSEEDLRSGHVQRAVTDYIKSASHLLNAVAYSRDSQVNFDSLTGQELDDLVQWIADRLLSQKRVLFGTPETCLSAIAELKSIGVDEIAFQLDFGVDIELVLRHMPYLNELKELFNSRPFVEESFARSPVNEVPAAREAAVASVDLTATQSPATQVQESQAHPSHQPAADPLQDIMARCREEVVVDEIVAGRDNGTDFHLPSVERLWRRDSEALGCLQPAEAVYGQANANPYGLHPSLLDACFDLLAATLPSGGEPTTQYLPQGFRSLQVHARPTGKVWSHALLGSVDAGGLLEGDVRILDESGNAVLVEVLGLQMQQVNQSTLARLDAACAAQSASSARVAGSAGTRSPNQTGEVTRAKSLVKEKVLAANAAEREQLLESYVCEQVARVLEMPVSRIDVREAINNFGLDSLMALQLKNQIEGELGVAVPVTTFLRGGSVSDLTKQLLEKLSQTTLAAPAEQSSAAVGDGPTEYPLSIGQQALWFMHQLSTEGASYNTLEIAASIRGELDAELLRRSFQRLIDRHPSLRTTYTVRDGKPVQLVLQHQEAHFEVFDASDWSDAQLDQRMADEYSRPFDLEQGPLLRVSLYRKSEREHLLLLVTHHITIDFLSLEIMFSELQTIYLAEKEEQAAPLAPHTVQYSDYVRWQSEMLAGAEGERLLSYWQKQLAGELPVLNLPTDRPRSSVPTLRGAIHSFPLDDDLTRRLRAFARAEGVTLYTTLLAAFYVLLHRYTNQEDIILNSPTASRSRSEFEEIVGYFANPVLLRASLAGNPTFMVFLNQVNKSVLGALDHQDYPFSLLVEQLQPAREPNRAPFSDVVFNLDRPLKGGAIGAMMGQPSVGELAMEPFVIENRVARYDLVLLLLEGEERFSAMLQYKSDLFDSSTIARMAEHYRILLGNIIEQPTERLSRIAMQTEEERAREALLQSAARGPQKRSLKSMRRKVVDLSTVNIVSMDEGRPGETFPLVIKPAVDDIDLVEWAHSNLELIETKLLEYGALLFHGFNVSAVSEFERFALTSCPELFGEYGDLPREAVSGKIYGSTPYPPEQPILMHNESSQMHCWPRKIWFYCATPPQAGGETPIVDCRKIYRRLDSHLRTRFAEKGLMYVRNFMDGLDVGWQEFFRTSERSVVEDYCRKVDMDFEWTDNGGLRTRKLCPAVARHPKTGEMVFFNQIQAHHVSCLAPPVRESLLSIFREEDLPRNVYYGDGSIIEDAVVEEILEVYRQTMVSFPWQQGDILMLDNMLSAHGRNPYTGPRKIMVTMGEMISAGDFQPGREADLEKATLNC